MVSRDKERIIKGPYIFFKKEYQVLLKRILNFKLFNLTDKETEKYSFICIEINVVKKSLLMATSVK